ncbi:MAG TPA: hypothetical protein VKB38_01020 [Terracidiphilus sp.]|nr:hypothetical protein [Terracidiphilus sp.]
MRLSKTWAALLILALILAAPFATRAATCTTQAELSPQDRDLLASTGQRLAAAVIQQDETTLHNALLPSVASQWDSIRGALTYNAPTVKGGQPQLRSLYVLDATGNAAPADTQFFCSSANGAMTVTVSLRELPPGRYAVVLADAAAAPLAGQIGFILGWDANAWKLGGLFIRAGMFDSHDGVFYWQRARELARSDSPWAAYYCYEAARYLLLPVDFISSPNLEKLGQEQAQIKGSPADQFPASLQSGDRTFKIDAIRFDPSLHQADLGITYQSTGVTDPAAQRTEATAVMSALLKAHPVMRQSFHGLWAYSSSNGKVTPVMELPMAQIP